MNPELPLLVAVGFFAGVCNAVVGGGTLFTFPVLIAAGIPPVLANTTTTVALLPGTMTSAFAYLPQLHPLRRQFDGPDRDRFRRRIIGRCFAAVVRQYRVFLTSCRGCLASLQSCLRFRAGS